MDIALSTDCTKNHEQLVRKQSRHPSYCRGSTQLRWPYQLPGHEGKEETTYRSSPLPLGLIYFGSTPSVFNTVIFSPPDECTLIVMKPKKLGKHL
jgi:hypothetical protein